MGKNSKRMVEQLQRDYRSAIHWGLIEQRRDIMEADPKEDGVVELQALHCPYYVELEGPFGADWGAIMHPSSSKFGQLVFEHEWCGCSFHNEVRSD